MTIHIKSGRGIKRGREVVFVGEEEIRQLMHHLILSEYKTITNALREICVSRAQYYRWINNDAPIPKWILEHYGIKQRVTYQLSGETYRKMKGKTILEMGDEG